MAGSFRIYDPKNRLAAEARRAALKRRDRARGTRTERGYSNKWDRARRVYLMNHPLCVICERAGRITAASVVDHIVPHKGNWELFWRIENWQALCAACHSKKTANEDGGFGRRDLE